MHQLPHREFNCCKCQEFFRILYTCAWDMDHFFILSFILISSFVLISSSHSHFRSFHSHFILSFSFHPFILISSFHSHFTGSLEQRKTLWWQLTWIKNGSWLWHQVQWLVSTCPACSCHVCAETTKYNKFSLSAANKISATDNFLCVKGFPTIKVILFVWLYQQFVYVCTLYILSRDSTELHA